MNCDSWCPILLEYYLKLSSTSALVSRVVHETTSLASQPFHKERKGLACETMRLPQCRIWFSAEAMAGKEGLMPSVSDLLRQSKRRKTVLTSIKEACATLRSAVDSLDECDMGELDLSEKATLAVAKHSLSAVVKSIKLMRSMPPTLAGQTEKNHHCFRLQHLRR